MTHARGERAALCDLLDRLGPDEPTLCAGWTTADLAAHLAIRER
ncbi:maleylpyruvate isomerase N-terminal domain-containing protein, partial [Nonomuraea fuscirosea]